MEEYKEWLEALARKHLRLAELYRSEANAINNRFPADLINDIEQVSSIGRLANAAKDRIQDRTRDVLVEALIADLREARVNKIIDKMDQVGILDATRRTAGNNIRRITR